MCRRALVRDSPVGQPTTRPRKGTPALQETNYPRSETQVLRGLVAQCWVELVVVFPQSKETLVQR